MIGPPSPYILINRVGSVTANIFVSLDSLAYIRWPSAG